MPRFKSICADTLCRFYTEKERCGGTKYLINRANFCFILQINTSIKFRNSSWISTLYNKAVLWSMKISTIRYNECRWAKIHLSATSSSTSLSSSITTTISSTISTRSSSIVVLKLSHLLIFNINYLYIILY